MDEIHVPAVNVELGDMVCCGGRKGQGKRWR